MRACSAFVIATLAIGTVQAAIARPFQRAPNLGDMTLRPLTAMSSADPALIEGKQATEGGFRASFFEPFDDQPKVPKCTATLVGPQTVLTAAHCVGDGKKVLIRSANIYEGHCAHHPAYQKGNNDPSMDLALCKMTETIPILAEKVSILSGTFRLGQLVLLSGYGCVNRDLSGGNDGIFRIGLAKIQSLTGTLSETVDGKKVPNYFTTIPDNGVDAAAVVCEGDSGGAVYCLQDPTKPYGVRTVCGVNSRFDCVTSVGHDCVSVGDTSYLAALSAPTSTKWFAKFIICTDTDVRPFCRGP